jgi:hypothetical protein
LATGRPAIVQDTGFSRHIPCGSGLHAFSDEMSAIYAIECTEANYQQECRTAREIAGDYFDSQKVLQSLLERSLACADSSVQQQ